MAAACGLLLLTAAAAVGASYLASADISTQRHLELGNRAFQQGRTTEAIEHFQAALFLDQGFAPARLARARAFLKADLYNEAVTDFQILNRETGNADGRLLAGLGYAYLLKGDNVNAIHSFREALRNGFATAAVHNDLAYCLIESGEPDRWSSVADALPLAYEHLAKALALKPAMQAAYINRALAALKESHLKVGFIPDNGIADAEEALKIGPASGRLHRIAAQLCSRAARLAPTRSTDATLAHLEAAATLGFSPDLIGSDAEFDWLKNEPRFQALIGRAKLPEGKETLPVVDPLAD